MPKSDRGVELPRKLDGCHVAYAVSHSYNSIHILQYLVSFIVRKAGVEDCELLRPLKIAPLQL